MDLTTYGDISPRTNFAAWARLLKRATPNIITERFAQTKEMPKGKGRTVKFRRYIKLGLATTPLSEGTPPAGRKVTYTDVQTSVDQHGDYIGITDVIQDTHEDPILNEFNSLLSEQMQETRETLNFYTIRGGTSVIYSGTVSQRTDVVAVIANANLKKAGRTLKGNDAKFFTEVLSGSPKYATTPVAASFVSLSHTDTEADIENLTNFKKPHEYGEPGSAYPGEVGACNSVRFITSTIFKPWLAGGAAVSSSGMIAADSTNIDVYPHIILAPDAWATVPLRGANSGQILVANPKPQNGDPLAQSGTLGWKFWHAAIILDDSRMTRIEAACKSSPT